MPNGRIESQNDAKESTWLNIPSFQLGTVTLARGESCLSRVVSVRAINRSTQQQQKISA